MTTTERDTAGTVCVDIHEQAAEMTSALRSLKPNPQRRKNQLFLLLYPVILEMLGQNVTQKAILKKLEEMGLKLHPSRFKELMAAAAKATAGETAAEENAA